MGLSREPFPPKFIRRVLRLVQKSYLYENVMWRHQSLRPTGGSFTGATSGNTLPELGPRGAGRRRRFHHCGVLVSSLGVCPAQPGIDHSQRRRKAGFRLGHHPVRPPAAKNAFRKPQEGFPRPRSVADHLRQRRGGRPSGGLSHAKFLADWIPPPEKRPGKS
jgi:hypothetical protein